MCISGVHTLEYIFQKGFVTYLIGGYPYLALYYLMNTFFQRIGTLTVLAWGLGIIGLLYYILKYLNGIYNFLVYMAGM